jgi:hypothetical protein
MALDFPHCSLLLPTDRKDTERAGSHDPMLCPKMSNGNHQTWSKDLKTLPKVQTWGFTMPLIQYAKLGVEWF